MGIVAAVTLFVWVVMALVTLHSYRHVRRLERIGAPRGGRSAAPAPVDRCRRQERGA